MIAIAIAGLALAATATVGLITFALRALGSERRAGELSRALAVSEAALEVEKNELAEMIERHDKQKGRADALDDLFANAALAGNVPGSYERMLQGWLAARAAHSGGTRVLPAPASPDTAGSDDLLQPGE